MRQPERVKSMARLIDADALKAKIETRDAVLEGHERIYICGMIDDFPTIEAVPVRHGRWIECDWKHLEHGMLESEPNAGLCCSNCRTGFQKKKMTYKQYCPACGARMDGGAENG